MFIHLFTVNSQVISNIISRLMVSTNAVIQLYQKLAINEEVSSNPRNKDMLKELEDAVLLSQSMFTKITTNRFEFHHFYYKNSMLFC